MRDPRYDILFTPLKIGPVVAKNRFFQVPHCNGMGHAMPLAHAAMRETKAEGGWAVVSTEECEIHPSGDLTPYVEARLWDDRDIPALALMCDKVHAHGALAALELSHNGPTASNLYSREVLIAPSHQPSKYGYPSQARAMTKHDIREYRRWHREAAIRGQRAGMDIIYVYAAHDLSLAMHFLQRRRNQRSDEYGGSLENRVRLLREVLEDTKDAVGDRCAVALRFATEELLGAGGVELAEAKEIVAMLAELPDLWDVNVAAWYNDSVPSRFAAEGAQEPFIDFVKQTTSKPVVGVGRFTSPDTMVSQLKRGVLDMIGCARPSIADPFLPKKIEEGRIDDIRECIGCNICVSGDMTSSPIRCTQNPTMGEEWRKQWHPERIAPKRSAARVLVVGAGPAGLEAARALGQRGYAVSVAEARKELGGRVTREARMPGLAEWARVRDWRVGQINKLANVAVYLDSALTAQNVFDFGAEHVVLATGCHWRRDGYGRSNGFAMADFLVNPRAIELGLDRVREVWQRMGGLAPAPQVITVGGTNGKGSTVALLEAMLKASGRSVGAFTSPHLLEYNERVRIKGRNADDAALVASFERIEAARGSIPLTYFEFGTLAALDLFARANVEVAVLEVGLGGRLDAVNIIDADVVVITTIDLDHMEWLGSDRDSIGREKAGIARANRPAIVGELDPPEGLLEALSAGSAKVVRAGIDFSVERHPLGWRWRHRDGHLLELPNPPLAAPVQIANAAAAVAALHALWQPGSVLAAKDFFSAVSRGLHEVRMHARLQSFGGDPLLVVDVGHNPQAARALAQWLDGQPPRSVHAVYGALADKDVAGVVAALGDRVVCWHLAGLEAVSPRGLDAHALGAIVRQTLPEASLDIHADVGEALAAAQSAARAGECILAFGSFHVASAVLAGYTG